MDAARCPECGKPFPEGQELPEGAEVQAVRPGRWGRMPETWYIQLQPRIPVSARWVRPLGTWVLLAAYFEGRDSWYARPPCGNPGEIVVFRGPQAELNARRAAFRWGQRARSQPFIGDRARHEAKPTMAPVPSGRAACGHIGTN